MRQALILCGGKSKRLRPYSYSLPKASLPFLNLPLLSFSWFYLEQLKVSHFLLNSHLFPKKLEDTTGFLSQDHQKINLFFEEEPLGSAGALYQLKKELKKNSDFIYINGDSLFFPSQKNKISAFEEMFFSEDLEALFFVKPYQGRSFKRALWCDKKLNLKFVGAKEELTPYQLKNLKPFYWTGLAWFKSALLDRLKQAAFDLFKDFINPLLSETNKIRVYADPLAVILEAGDKQSYLKSTRFCLECLFQSEKDSTNSNWDRISPAHLSEGNRIRAVKEGISNRDSFLQVKKLLEECFNRYDPQDYKVGLKNGKKWSQKWNQPLLLPKSVKGLNFLKLTGPAVVGSEVCFFDSTVLENCVLDSNLIVKGLLKEDLIFKTRL